ncbi:cation diffusion facilitator family transporter [Lactococcus nasutitermitis]|uniref:Cation diffusion facilitator family transporter n=1 Tax=Lactococcus nasutitermitis TaxID=1652957 RepID=A0ABV9JFN7_9LACT|nr:cation diffusion facilitator family transporter [Lactococcus nasutitermitis]
MQNIRTNNLKIAERGIWVSIGAYIFLSIGQIAVAELVHSDALRANGFNNVTDILGNIAILIGLRIARIPKDADHTYGHWKVESIASLISSFIMFLVGFEVLRETVMNFVNGTSESVDPIGSIAGLLSGLIMLVVYFYSRNLAKKTRSQALIASSKDNLSDSLTSFGTAIAVVASAIHMEWLDKVMAVVICAFILKTAYDIFRDSTFSLSDGFDDNLLIDYQHAVEQLHKVKRVKMMRGRMYGSNIFLDVVVEMSPDLSVFESHEATEDIENLLREQFDVFDTDVHVEPAALPEEEQFASRALELLPKEEQFLNDENIENLIEKDNFQEILFDGTVINSVEKLTKLSKKNLAIKNYQAKQVSKKTFILTYEYTDSTASYMVSSTWRRNEYWYCIFRQTTKIIKE